TTRAEREKTRKLEAKKREKRLLPILCSVAALTAAQTNSAIPPRPMRTSILTGQRWVRELQRGHPTRFQEQMGVTKVVYYRLLLDLQIRCGLRDGKYV
ncbi:hypothetical protein FB107DRAFT_189757, partial [Schizophyllum commune]